jgi:hypothetical protein
VGSYPGVVLRRGGPQVKQLVAGYGGPLYGEPVHLAAYVVRATVCVRKGPGGLWDHLFLRACPDRADDPVGALVYGALADRGVSKIP